MVVTKLFFSIYIACVQVSLQVLLVFFFSGNLREKQEVDEAFHCSTDRTHTSGFIYSVLAAFTLWGIILHFGEF